jgi:two-component system, LytTR family, response regulator LytT
MQHLKILIVDDEILIAEHISDTLKSFGVKQIKMAHDKISATAIAATFVPSVVLLDIRMESETTGLQLGTFLQEKNIPFIYITSHTDVAMVEKIIKTKPFAYLSKPLKKSDLLANLLLFKEKSSTIESSQITITDNGTAFIINTHEIVYAKSEGNYITVYCDNDTYVFRLNLETFYAKINDGNFYKPHRSYIINLNKIKSYTRTEILISDVSIPLSRLLVQDFFDSLQNRNS